MHHEPELLLDEPALPWDEVVPRWPARIDIRLWLALLLAMIVAVVASSRASLPLAVFIASVAALLAMRLPPGGVLGRLAAPLGLTLVVCVLRVFLTGKTPWLTFTIGPWTLVATREGLNAGALIGLRVLGSVGALLVLTAAAPAERLFAALAWARVPRTIVDIAQLMHRYIFVLLHQAAAVRAAQRVRLGYVGFRRGMASLGSLAGLIILRSVDQAERTHEAMLARGYQGRLPLATLPPLGRAGRLALAAGLSGIALLYFAAERWLP